MDSVPALAIGTYSGDYGFYLFYCNSAWEPLTDTYHQTLDDAKAQAEFEYHGIQSHWQHPA